jgi:hypothetical protein
MTYTRKVGSHARVTIDGVDVSNSFRTITPVSEDADLPAGGFNVSGVAETLPGERTQRFEGEAWYTEELGAILQPLYAARTAFVMTVQPDGLIDATREIYSGSVRATQWSPPQEFGAVSTVPFTAIAADSTGITVGNWT